MLKEFDGDQEKALAAYNAGPDVLKKAIQQEPENWLSLLPKETREYVADILGGLSQKK
jgi:soluble lytic murein transglycosylase-like protein